MIPPVQEFAQGGRGGHDDGRGGGGGGGDGSWDGHDYGGHDGHSGGGGWDRRGHGCGDNESTWLLGWYREAEKEVMRAGAEL